MLFLFVNVKCSITKLVSANIYITHIHAKLDLTDSVLFTCNQIAHGACYYHMQTTVCATADEIHGLLL